jgi:hypothetical protein
MNNFEEVCSRRFHLPVLDSGRLPELLNLDVWQRTDESKFLFHIQDRVLGVGIWRMRHGGVREFEW